MELKDSTEDRASMQDRANMEDKVSTEDRVSMQDKVSMGVKGNMEDKGNMVRANMVKEVMGARVTGKGAMEGDKGSQQASSLTQARHTK